MGRPHGCTEKLPSRKGFWDDYEEDTQKTGFVSRNRSPGNWASISKKTGRRVERSSRTRWSNRGGHDVDDQEDNFSSQEEELIIKLHATIGSRWTIIAQQLPGRTDNDVKNLWNTKLKKKLSAMGIDPVTHKPFSQILADYGNIGGFPSPASRFGTLNRALKTTFPSTTQAPSAPVYCFHKNDDDSNHHQYIDLLSELQAIKSITESANYSTPDPVVSPPSSSSSLTSPLAATRIDNNTHQENASSSSGFSWCDFLLEDAFLAEPNQAAADHNATPELNEISSSDNHLEAAASSSSSLQLSNGSSSFVEAMLSSQDDMFLEFPGLSEEPFYY